MAYELKGEWQSQPEQVVSGKDVLGAKWTFDINDDGAAPSNDPIADNVLEVALSNGVFTEIPSVCRTEGVDPVSTLSADRRSLTCNIGERDEGTAQVSVTGVLADGPAGSELTATATFRELTAELPPIPITNAFDMEAKFDGGAPLSYPMGNDQYLEFPFSLSHKHGAPAGAESVSFDVEIKNLSRPAKEAEVVSCDPNNRVQSGYPYSDTEHEAERTAPFPSCELTKTGPTSFTLTLSGLAYADGPVLDSNGEPLPAGYDVIAAGILKLSVPYSSGLQTQVSLNVDAPTFTAIDGQEAADHPENNANRAAIVRGRWTGGWIVSAQQPKAYPGGPWTDTSRAPAGSVVMSVGGVRVPFVQYQGADNWLCKVLDTEHVTLDAVRVATDGSVPNIYYDNSYEGKIWYYTGELKNPGSDEVVDPNVFECGGKTVKGEEEAGNQEGWTTEPGDLADVKAVKIRVSRDMLGSVTTPNGSVFLMVDQKIKPDTPIGTDIWTWTSALEEGASDWSLSDSSLRYFNRTTDPADAPGYAKKTPDLRYPYTGPGRDVLRTVGSEPLITKSVAQSEYGPGQDVEYQVDYGLETTMANPQPDTVVITDKLPAELTYIEGSAPTEPDVTETDDGQELTWTFENITPNEELDTLMFKAKLADDVKLGATLTNEATATSQGIIRTDEASFLVPTSGYTTLLKTATEPEIEATDGQGENSWTITMASKYPGTAAATDVIDILPYVGDERGTDFTGDLTLTQVEAEGTVYYTTADPTTIDEDPAAASNGAIGVPSDMWSTEYTEDATAIRVIGGPLSYGQTQDIIVTVAISEAEGENLYVNTAVGRADGTENRMRTSDFFTAIAPEEPEPTPEPKPDPKPEPSP
ncbi:MAG: isopeptide-forming domain-containing fimbrial protein, partial [Flaviflexus sp.]|nr:isopeptide-forming domain-containing fimbrial protein [Flaviflexus sp.]